MSFDLKNGLINYYKQYPQQEVLKILSKLERRSDNYKQALYNKLLTSCPKNFGFPDVAAINKAELSEEVRNVASEVSKRTFWAVCDKCHSYYDYSLFFCPVCYKNGHKVMRHTVKVSETGIMPEKIVRYNLQSPGVIVFENKNCFTCKDSENSYCIHFGKPEYSCPQQEFEMCACKQCCIKARKSNKETLEKWKKREEEKLEREINATD